MVTLLIGRVISKSHDTLVTTSIWRRSRTQADKDESLERTEPFSRPWNELVCAFIMSWDDTTSFLDREGEAM